MKKLILLLFVLSLFSATSCNSDDDNSSQNPIDQLPPETQTGANTFGALLDGDVFIPQGVPNLVQCNYQLINGERYFFVTGRMRDNTTFELFSLSITTNAKEIVEGETYSLIEEADGNATGIYGYNGDLYFTNGVESGEVTISRLDMNNQIVSGAFWFDVIDQNGDLRQIREGRFDMQFTQ
jgi:hypothetical protein